MGSCSETVSRAGRAAAHHQVIVTFMMDPPRTVLVLVLLVSLVHGLMVMDEPSCQEVEEAECGLCHTVYMEECKMEMVHEMMPKKVSMCRSVTRYEEKCETIMRERMVEEKRPICKLEVMKTGKVGSKKVMRCKLGMKRMKKMYPKVDCKKVAAGQEEKHEVKKCSFHPRTVCHPAEGRGCRMVKKK